MTNRIKITTRDGVMALDGDADYVEKAYGAVRQLMLERFVEAIHGTPPEPAIPPDAPVANKVEARPHLSVVTCNEVYHKIHLAERDALQGSDFARSIDFGPVKRIYVNRDQQETFKEYLPFGKVLWRELTAAGRHAIRKANG